MCLEIKEEERQNICETSQLKTDTQGEEQKKKKQRS